jgi:hypothetical protein
VRFWGKVHERQQLVALADAAAFTARVDGSARIDWVVYAKPPFAGPEQVLGYLGRYTHRVALANSRLVSIDDGQVSFTWKDYRQDGKTKGMTLTANEFIRRLIQHTVPDGFHRIRHLGFLAKCQTGSHKGPHVSGINTASRLCDSEGELACSKP